MLTALTAVGFVVVSVAMRVGLWLGSGFLEAWPLARSLAVGALMLTAAVCVTSWLVRRFPDLHSPTLALLPRRSTPPWFLLGATGGAVLFFTVFTCCVLLGGFRPTPAGAPFSAIASMLTLGLLATIINAAWEEYTFRGWPFSIATKAFNGHAVAVTLGLLFGLAHLFSTKEPSFSAILSIFFAGLFLSYSYLASGSITFVIGLHTGWNFTQSLLTSRTLWLPHDSPHTLLTGGPWGLEASLPGIIITALAALCAFVCYLRST